MPKRIRGTKLNSTEENELKVADRIYNTFEACRNKAEKAQFYSSQRIDLIIISISSGAILISVNAIEFAKAMTPCGKIFFFLPILSYGLSIVSNIFSQVYAEKAHGELATWARTELKILNGQIGEEKEYLSKEKEKNEMVLWFNTISLVALIIGIICSMISLAILIS